MEPSTPLGPLPATSLLKARKQRLYKKKQAEFDVARKRLVEEQREEMRQRQESFKAARQKVKLPPSSGHSFHRQVQTKLSPHVSCPRVVRYMLFSVVLTVSRTTHAEYHDRS